VVGWSLADTANRNVSRIRASRMKFPQRTSRL
jgi:hypothetical protein